MQQRREKRVLLILILLFFSYNVFSQEKQERTKNTIKSADTNKSEMAKRNKVLPASNALIEKPKENISNLHFENEIQSTEVLNKMNYNKSHQRPLSEGILKSYKIEIKSCTSGDNTKKTFAYLNNTKGFVKADFLSTGLVNLIVIPEFNSVDLKDKMLSKGLIFNFISETYFLK